ncbi:hypothetical protein EIN_379390 [Entamoeba invadens IP1]|uniref:Peptidyl-prolyl cis-trans isomerase n=1 Tax=Entamoeba invadens IP1 TaxID=370355 RepID=A0A0A1UAK4_ENTIV|nr:hypothetical protein EIN_379390 [Entamoeba invadens IP1]ELP92072.1 hypothetical protein EIN_379390 [Entamoeba invadens IP1]|eukprot:XP_004258843.1 hypothetical protein EIN_379390 [Entamoeba invadens IP1]
MSVFLETSLGNIVVDLFVENNPVGSMNFLKLIKLNHYKYSVITKVIKDYAFQFDNKYNLEGTCVTGVLVHQKGELMSCTPKKPQSNKTAGIVGFLSHGQHKIGSEVYVTTADGIESIQGIPFGKVAEGMDVVQKINELLVDTDDKPFQNIRIISHEIFEDPFPDPKGFPEVINEPKLERDDHPEVEDLVKEITEDVERKMKENEARSRAEILEMVGDLPFAEIKPPENVLFVCKLNQCTRDSDLEAIFDKFGKVVSAEVICDKKTGNSLGYAFIEFEAKEACEEAYKKMDNVIIDDRRIHVDFSQSIGKYGVKYDFIRRKNKWEKVDQNDPRKRVKKSTFKGDFKRKN